MTLSFTGSFGVEMGAAGWLEAADAALARSAGSELSARTAEVSGATEESSAGPPESESFELPGVARRSRTISAKSNPMVLECVFLSSTPSSGSISRITPGFTSNSRASSLILIFDIIVAVDTSAGASSMR